MDIQPAPTSQGFNLLEQIKELNVLTRKAKNVDFEDDWLVKHFNDPSFESKQINIYTVLFIGVFSYVIYSCNISVYLNVFIFFLLFIIGCGILCKVTCGYLCYHASFDTTFTFVDLCVK